VLGTEKETLKIERVYLGWKLLKLREFIWSVIENS